MSENTIKLQNTCNYCGALILELERLPEGQENEPFACPICGENLGVGFKITKAQEPEADNE